MSETEWYENLREQWKPENVRLLLIGESAPDDGGDPLNRRFFYAEPLSGADNLFRSVVAALYNGGKLTKGDRKEPWLRRLQADGVYLLDLSPVPVNALSARDRRAALKGSVGDCVQRIADLSPEGIIVCHGPSFVLLEEPLLSAGLPLIHRSRIPFPLGNTRQEFIDKVRDATRRRWPHYFRDL